MSNNSDDDDKKVHNYMFVEGVPDWVFWLLIAIVALTIIIVIVIFAVPNIRKRVMPYRNREFYNPTNSLNNVVNTPNIRGNYDYTPVPKPTYRVRGMDYTDGFKGPIPKLPDIPS